ncbi:MAG: hypothetical protein AAGF66_05860 [Cyanobacteria bacterium P01_H01_bin.119]
MRISPAIIFTLTLLALMTGAGFASGTWGYGMGREALAGVRQPDARPFNDYGNQGSSDGAQRHNLILVKESEVLEDVKARMNGGLR